MKHAGEMFEALKSGDLEGANKYLRTYGTTITRSDTDDKKGCHSVITVGYYTRRFIIEMRNGNTLAVSVDGVRYTPAEK